MYFRQLLAPISICLLISSDGVAQEHGWTLSASSTDPRVNSTVATGEVEFYYLWFVCLVGETRCSCGAEIGLDASGPTPLAFVPLNGWLNAGSAVELLLAGGHHTGPFLVGQLLTRSEPGTIGFRPTDYGVLASHECHESLKDWPIEWVGLGLDQPPPTGGSFCKPNTVAVEGTSWGGVKGLYR